MINPSKDYLDTSMLPSVEHNPPTTYGDCYRTALCVVMGLHHNEVPHVLENPGMSDIEVGHLIETSLSDCGWSMTQFTVSSDMSLEEAIEQGSISTPSPFLLAGCTANGVGHIVVVHRGKVVNNIGCDLAGPCPITDLYHIKLVTPYPAFWNNRP